MFDSNLNEDAKYDIMLESKQTLRNIKQSKKHHSKDLLTELSDGFKRYDSGRDMYDVYETIHFEGKSTVDMMYYNQLLNKIEESEQLEKIQTLLTTLTRNVKQVYEITNLKPEIYGRKIDIAILENSQDEASSKISKQIYEYLDNNFYKLNIEKRNEKYFNESSVISKKLITEGVSTDDAIEYSVKCVVMEGLLRKIAFPFAIQSRIDHLIESDIYAKIFDSERLVENVENVDKDIQKIASIIAVVI